MMAHLLSAWIRTSGGLPLGRATALDFVISCPIRRRWRTSAADGRTAPGISVLLAPIGGDVADGCRPSALAQPSVQLLVGRIQADAFVCNALGPGGLLIATEAFGNSTDLEISCYPVAAS
jgi:hypothetical protein